MGTESKGTQAIYVRTSIEEKNDGQAQLHTLRKAAEARGWTDVREFLDIGQSGAKASRPALDELRRAALKGEIRELMVTEMSRLGRDLVHLILLVDQLHAAGCSVVLLREGIDLTTPAGRMVGQFFGALAEFERSMIRERIKSGMAKVKATGRTRSGKPVGRPKRDVDGTAVERMRQAGQSWRDIARALKVPVRTARRAWQKAGQKQAA
jgi:DNA invertase Pin-like site-specific DNA recombinase